MIGLEGFIAIAPSSAVPLGIAAVFREKLDQAKAHGFHLPHDARDVASGVSASNCSRSFFPVSDGVPVVNHFGNPVEVGNPPRWLPLDPEDSQNHLQVFVAEVMAVVRNRRT